MASGNRRQNHAGQGNRLLWVRQVMLNIGMLQVQLTGCWLIAVAFFRYRH